MSHIPLRKEKDCLNCGATVQGRYCHDCGQENVVPHETFWHMVTHFFYDITHFDSKFFETVKDLLFKPGFLTKQYVEGKRASYLHPIKMYVFTSAVFFLIFFSFFQPKANFKSGDGGVTIQTDNEPDSSVTVINFVDVDYRTLREYDSVQSSLPKGQRDKWIRKRLIRQQLTMNEEFRKDRMGFTNKFMNSVIHRMPYMLFVSLPLFALLLKLVYIRRKEFFYADHGIFTIHLYVFTFIMLLLILTLSRIGEITGKQIFGWIVGILVLLLFFYLYKGMRRFYRQRRAKTVIKFLLVALFSLIMMIILFILFTILSAITF